MRNLISSVQMNQEGWISIPLLASFNRVKQLTRIPDAELVREVLTLSSTAEVSGDWVRMANNQWTRFVLPPLTSQPTPPETATAQESGEEDGSVEEEDEDDVEFLMNQDNQHHSWTSQRHPS